MDVIENEDVAAGKPVAHIRASDKDEASTLNARIQYTLEGEGAEKFMLEKESGMSDLLRCWVGAKHKKVQKNACLLRHRHTICKFSGKSP